MNITAVFLTVAYILQTVPLTFSQQILNSSLRQIHIFLCQFCQNFNNSKKVIFNESQATRKLEGFQLCLTFDYATAIIYDV